MISKVNVINNRSVHFRSSPHVLFCRNPLTLEYGVPTCILAGVTVHLLVVLVPYLVNESELQRRDHHGHRGGQRRAVEPHALLEVDHLGGGGVGWNRLFRSKLTS